MRWLILLTLLSCQSTQELCDSSPIANSKQLIISLSPDDQATDSEISLWEKKRNRFQLIKTFPAKIGRNGLTIKKQEGDGKSPAGIFKVYSAFGQNQSIPSKMPYRQVDQNSHCIDDVAHPDYNKIVHNFHKPADSSLSTENLKQVGAPYELALTVDYNGMNQGQPIPGKGSCIFLHIWKRDKNEMPVPTAGCTSMSRAHLYELAYWLKPKKSPRLIQMTQSQYQAKRKAWCLP